MSMEDEKYNRQLGPQMLLIHALTYRLCVEGSKESPFAETESFLAAG